MISEKQMVTVRLFLKRSIDESCDSKHLRLISNLFLLGRFDAIRSDITLNERDDQ